MKPAVLLICVALSLGSCDAHARSSRFRRAALSRSIQDPATTTTAATAATTTPTPTTTRDPKIDAVLFGERELGGTLQRMSSTLADTSLELQHTQTSLSTWQASLSALGARATEDLDIVNTNAANRNEVAAMVASLEAGASAQPSSGVWPLNATLGSLQVYNASATALATQLSGASSSSAGGSVTPAPQPDGNISQRLDAANATLRANSSSLRERFDVLRSVERSMRYNVTEFAERSLQRALERDLAIIPATAADEVMGILSAHAATASVNATASNATTAQSQAVL